MQFIETFIKGAFIIELESINDSRGFFARSYCQNEMREKGLKTEIVQANISFNKKAGTLRGMHFQEKPFDETKIVRCTSGSIYDVILDLRQNSETYKKWESFTLTDQNRKMLYIPGGIAHGFITMVDNTEVFYLHSEFFTPNAAKGILWNDPAFDIEWPDFENIVMSDKDKNWPKFES